MASPETVTVDRNYFKLLLRRADFNASHELPASRAAPTHVSISSAEYDALLRLSREYKCLKNALREGGLVDEALQMLISGAETDGNGKSLVVPRESYDVDVTSHLPGAVSPQGGPGLSHNMQEEPRAPFHRLTKADQAVQGGDVQAKSLEVSTALRHASYGWNSSEAGWDESDSLPGAPNAALQPSPDKVERRTLYLIGFAASTTYRDLLSIMKGGKLLSVHLRPDRCALATFYDGAQDFLAWSKRNDIYLKTKRIEVKWADRQHVLNNHIASKVANGATRNIFIHGAVEKGLREFAIRQDMEHVHNLVIIDVVFRHGGAYVSTNSVHHALFARTCMMSRAAYKGCKIGFFPDECDTPLPPQTTYVPKPIGAEMQNTKGVSISNRFGMLNMDDTDTGSDEESQRPPHD